MKSGYWPLPARALVRVTGADAARYLNGQLSNDLRKLQPGQAMRACLLTAKGKLVADPFVWRDGEAFVLETSADLADALMARLDRYIVADDVTLEVVEAPPTDYHVVGSDSTSGRAINRIGITGMDVAEPPPDLPRLTEAEWQEIRIRHAMPSWGAELDEDTLPAEARLDELAVDFHKGCYVGQEVVSRMESAGRVRQTLAVLESSAPLKPGTELLNADSTAVGRITSSAATATGGVALAWLRPALAEPGNLLKAAGNESDSLTEIKVIEKLP